jgi:hypothetical protein
MLPRGVEGGDGPWETRVSDLLMDVGRKSVARSREKSVKRSCA